jgi:hypothetical protein
MISLQTEISALGALRTLTEEKYLQNIPTR